MGVAIVIDSDFSRNNIGKVTFLTEDIPLTGLSISGSDLVSGINSQYSIRYLPANTTQKGVVWSIESGSDYANIDSNSGLLTIKAGANNSSVTIKASSIRNPLVTDTKNITVTYDNTILLTRLTISGDSIVNGPDAQYSAVYTPSNTTQKGVNWSIANGSQYAEIDNNGKLTVKSGAASNHITIKIISSVNPEILATKDITVSYGNSVNVEGISITGPDSTNEITTQYGVSYTPSDTTQKGVAWSIESGSDYASIDSSTGILTVKSGANASPVTIKAASVYNSSVTTTKSITVSYPAVTTGYWDLMGHVGYVPIPKPNLTGFSCLIELENEISPTSGDTVNIIIATQSMGVSTSGRCHLAVSSAFSMLYARSSNFDAGNGEGWKGTNQNKESRIANTNNKVLLINSDNMFQGESTTSLSKNDWTLLSSNVGMGQFTGYLQFGTKITGGDAYKYPTNEDLSTAVTNGEVSANNIAGIKIKTFILFCSTKYATAAEMLAHRANADVDIRFGGNGAPYNAGTSGALIYSGY